jgi:hypothetical protein
MHVFPKDSGVCMTYAIPQKLLISMLLPVEQKPSFAKPKPTIRLPPALE